MNKKVSLLIVSIILAIIVFSVSTYMQRKLVNYVPTVKCLCATKDIEQYTSFSKDDFKIVDMPIEIVSNVKIINDPEEAEGLYLKEKLFKGQILLDSQLDTDSNLKIFNTEEGKEKISIRIKNSENGVSFIVKPGSIINIYATLNSEYVATGAFSAFAKRTAGEEYSGYSIIKVVSNVKVLGTFDENGEELDENGERIIDTVLVAVTPEEAEYINLLREIASFNITEI